MATATETKPKAAKAIVTTKIAADGVVHVLAKSAHDQLDRAYELVALLAKVPEWHEVAEAAMEPLGKVIDLTRKAVKP